MNLEVFACDDCPENSCFVVDRDVLIYASLLEAFGKKEEAKKYLEKNKDKIGMIKNIGE